VFCKKNEGALNVVGDWDCFSNVEVSPSYSSIKITQIYSTLFEIAYLDIKFKFKFKTTQS
jgi:hypothetical protein